VYSALLWPPGCLLGWGDASPPCLRKLRWARSRTENGQGGLASQPLGVVFKATIKSAVALSVPMPAKEIDSGAACATSRSRCASSSEISSERASRCDGPPNGARTTWSQTLRHEDRPASEARGHLDELFRREPTQTAAQLLRRPHAHALQLVGSL
jgi:hypothetical protein